MGGQVQSAEAQIEEVKKGGGETGAKVKHLEAKVQELGKKTFRVAEKFHRMDRSGACEEGLGGDGTGGAYLGG